MFGEGGLGFLADQVDSFLVSCLLAQAVVLGATEAAHLSLILSGQLAELSELLCAFVINICDDLTLIGVWHTDLYNFKLEILVVIAAIHKLSVLSDVKIVVSAFLLLYRTDLQVLTVLP